MISIAVLIVLATALLLLLWFVAITAFRGRRARSAGENSLDRQEVYRHQKSAVRLSYFFSAVLLAVSLVEPLITKFLNPRIPQKIFAVHLFFLGLFSMGIVLIMLVGFTGIGKWKYVHKIIGWGCVASAIGIAVTALMLARCFLP